jgi:hypothetical protein
MSEPDIITSSTSGDQQQNYQWVFSILDTSRVSTFFISILLIVYGSFRSLALEEENPDDPESDPDDSKDQTTGCALTNGIHFFSLVALRTFIKV